MSRDITIRRVVPLVLAAFLGCASAESDEQPQASNSGGPAADASASRTPRPPAKRAWVIFGTDTIVAEVARTDDERAAGLMYRENVPDGTGMLFVFEDSAPRSFWMSNTYAALDIAYMGPTFSIVDIQQMEPQTTTPHESAAAAQFALEVRQGWFAEHGIGVGARPQVVFGLQ